MYRIHKSMDELKNAMMPGDNEAPPENILYDNVKGKKVIIWGMGLYGRRILDYYEGSGADITIWDKNWKNMGGGGQCRAPSIESLNPGDHVILAFGNEDYYKECRDALIGSGIFNVYDGKCLVHMHYSGAKIIGHYSRYKDINTDTDFKMDDSRLEIYTRDMFGHAGTSLNDHYLNQDLWGAKKVYRARPAVHYDIGSRIDGFITHLLSFEQKVVLIDIRPLDTYGMKNLTFINQDATLLPGIADNSIESLSALCSLEHFGLGRFGDPLDPDAHLKAFTHIQRVMMPGGNAYISLPVSKSCYLCFNAHRVYSPEYVIEKFKMMDLKEFAYVGAKGINENADIGDLGEDLYTGLFQFQKR